MSSLFREEALENQRERLWGDVILIQPLSFYLITGAVVVVVALIGMFLVYGTLRPPRECLRLSGAGSGVG